MTLQKQPNPIDFLGNKPEFVIRATPNVTSGRTARLQARFLFLESGTLFLRSPHAPISDSYYWRWNVGSGGDDIGSLTAIPAGTANGGELIKSQLERKLKYHPDIIKYYNVNCFVDGNGYCCIDIESWIPEAYDELHQLLIYATGGGIGTLSMQTPLPRNIKQDYRISYLFEYSHRFNILEKQGTTPELFTEPADGIVTASCRVMEGLFGAPDIPKPLADFDNIYKNGILLRLVYAEYYNNESGYGKKSVHVSEWCRLFNGKIGDYNAQYNLPGENSDSGFANTDTAVLFSQNNNEYVYFDDPGTEQYLYVANFTGSTAVISLSISGIPSINVADRTFNIQSGLVYRIGTSLEALGISNAGNVLSYTITLKDSTDPNAQPIVIAVRTYERKRYDFGAHTFLMLNDMNLYETMIIDNIEEEVITEGERHVFQSVDSYSTTDEQTVFKAVTGYRTAQELRLLKTALGKQHNLLVDRNDRSYVWHIDMIPGSVKILDEKEDLTSCEFQFRKRNRSWRRLTRVGQSIVDTLPNMSQAILE